MTNKLGHFNLVVPEYNTFQIFIFGTFCALRRIRKLPFVHWRAFCSSGPFRVTTSTLLEVAYGDILLIFLELPLLPFERFASVNSIQHAESHDHDMVQCLLEIDMDYNWHLYWPKLLRHIHTKGEKLDLWYWMKNNSAYHPSCSSNFQWRIWVSLLQFLEYQPIRVLFKMNKA